MPRPEKTVIDWIIKSNSGKLERWQLDMMKNLKIRTMAEIVGDELLETTSAMVTNV